MTLKSTKTSAKTALKTINTQNVSMPAKLNTNYRHNQIAKSAYYLSKNEFKGESIAH